MLKVMVSPFSNVESDVVATPNVRLVWPLVNANVSALAV
jgi:hypothetical protein